MYQLIIQFMKYFKTLAIQLNSNKNLSRYYINIPTLHTRQSSVAMIFKINTNKNWQKYRTNIESYYVQSLQKATHRSICSTDLLQQILDDVQDENVQLLFTQRANSEKDHNAGNIVFPGGKCEDGQTDLVACLRETKQEIGIKLLENQQEHNTTSYLTLYLGKLTKNFFYRKHKNEYLYISCHVFVILNSNVTIILNTSQLIDSKWVKITDLIKPTNILFQQDKKSFISNFTPQKLFFLKNSILKNLEYVRYPTLDVFLNRHLWGITFHIWMHCLRIIKFKLKQKNGYEQQQINKFIQQGEKFSIKFKWYYLPGYLIKHIGYDWNYRQRILQFQYPQLKQWKKNLKKIMVYSVFSLLVLPFSIYCIYFD